MCPERHRDVPAGPVSVVWFRRDLRLADNPALVEAAAAGGVAPLFCFDRGLLTGRHASPSRNAYLLESLRELDEGLKQAGTRLHLREGDPSSVVPRFAAEAGARAVHVNADFTVHALDRDGRVRDALAERDVELVSHGGVSCVELDTVRTGAGDPFRVFTPFHRVWLAVPRRAVEHHPNQVGGLQVGGPRLAVGRPPAMESVGIDAGARGRASAAGAGEAASRRLMKEAIDDAGDYERVRDLPGLDSTTRLSAALHFGTISARELEAGLASLRSQGAKALRRQLAWRDFWLSVIAANPGNRRHEHDARFRGIDWRDDPEGLAAWKAGETGVPWIDAGMRQLLEEGWMHNRLRMAVASYLTKNLLIDWREGESHFMQHLVDGDEAQNNGNWQWSASVGADAQPWFRVFNPVRQQQRFDPGGVYVRRWAPELAALPDRWLATPWDAPEDVQRDAGVVIGRDYPAPLVDLADSRREAIAHFRSAAG